jgi:hypothetical protein
MRYMLCRGVQCISIVRHTTFSVAKRPSSCGHYWAGLRSQILQHARGPEDAYSNRLLRRRSGQPRLDLGSRQHGEAVGPPHGVRHREQQIRHGNVHQPLFLQ